MIDWDAGHAQANVRPRLREAAEEQAQLYTRAQRLRLMLGAALRFQLRWAIARF